MVRRSSLSLVVFLLLSSCAAGSLGLHPAAVLDATALDAAAEAFYRAETPGQLTAAVDDARRAGPDTARFHELAARLAQLEGREDDVVTHLAAALQDPANDAPLLHLHLLAALDLPWRQRPLIRALLEALGADHPSDDVRALAAHHLAQALHLEGDLEGRDAAMASIRGQLDLAWVGAWDNDQGKGFDLELGPEKNPGLEQSYDGRTGVIRWRRDVPKDPRGRYDLLQLMTPTRWSAAFAQGTLHAPADGAFALRLTTTDPVKVWVDGHLVFALPVLERSAFDQLIIPLALTRGAHRLLIKSAHREGSWHLSARLTPHPGPAGTAAHDAQLAARVGELPRGSARAWAHLVAWGHLGAGGVTTVRLADEARHAFPRSLVLRAWQVDALWFNQERGRTADLLAALDQAVGEALPFVRLRQARFDQQQGLKQRARERLLELQKTRPHLREVWEQLADLWRGEGWTEDELRVMRERDERFGSTPDEDVARSRALSRHGRRAEALAVLERVLDRLPTHPEALRRVAELASEAGDLEEAREAWEDRLASWPEDSSAWLALAEVHRRRGDRAGAEAALARAQALTPEAAVPRLKAGELAYEAGDTPAAVALWRRAVELNPENEALANRVDFLAPESRGPWMADVPDAPRLDALVRQREGLTQKKGADLAYLLDHEVTLVNTDGSTSNVVTLVVHAFNAQGRDRIIRQAVGPGRLRVLHAYAVDDKGQRSEASSERNRQIFFRGMQPGSTLVLQYRLDTPPRGFLARYYTESWSFQGVGDQREESTLVLWLPRTAKLHLHQVGAVAHAEAPRGEHVRHAWTATQTPPLVSEPGMPTVGELALNLHLSTVPDWQTWLSWEQALLEGVFRDSPELDAVARALGRGEPDPEERLRRVHTFVMEEIRYQQDYESFIAGVKPHAAPVVLERRYGDCKDKAVLFIELARKLGLDAHFALVRTRDVGPVRRDVPMQQFNHAIVYVPEQPGVQARFFDPTAEVLDVDSVRSDDVGTWALVFDPRRGGHAWREVPFQAPEANREKTTLALTLDAQGGAKGTLTLEAVGRAGSVLRRTARNQEVFSQVAQRVAAAHLPNVTTSEVRALEAESLRVPAAIRMDVAATAFARAEGDTLRVRFPSDANPRSTFALASRRHPLVLGAPQQTQMEVELELPPGLAVRRLPAGGVVALPCLSLSRQVTQAGRVVTSRQTWRTTCERLSAEAYAQHRAQLDALVRLLDDELVLGPEAAAKRPGRAAAGPAKP